MEQKEEKKEKKRLNFNFKLFKQKVNIIFNELKPLLKNPKVWIAVFLIWYIESPIMVMINKGFFNVSLISLYLNPFKLAFEFITSFSVIWTFIKFNLAIFFIFVIICLVMHLMGKETGKIIDIEKLKIIKDSLKEQEGEIKFSNRGDYGTARWATRESLEKANRKSVAAHSDEYVKITKDGSDGLIYGYLGDVESPKKGVTPIMTLPKKTTLNRNFAVFGSSGSMKSRSFVIPNILNLIKNGESFFATDPKGELLSKTSKVLKDNGYNVKAFNINNIPCSHRWNVLKEIKDEQSASIFAKAIVENTRVGDAGDEFWENHYINFLKALALYVVKNEPEERQNMRTVYEYITYPEGFAGLDALIGRALNDDPLHPAYQSWTAFKTAAGNEKVSAGVMSGLAIRLDTLQIPQFCDLLSGNDIDLIAPGKEKCAYFIVVPDTHSTFNFLAGLFFTFAFIDLLAFADKLNGALPIQVNFLLDEFPNIAKIPEIEKKISTVRSRGVNICIIFQNYTQLCSRYSKEVAEELLGNCDSKIFLGANEMTTSNYISDMLGDATIEVETVSKDMFSFFPDKKSIRLDKRNLKTPDEVYNKHKKNSYVKIIGLQPILCTKMDYTMHEMGDLVVETPIYEMLQDWSKKYHEEYLESIAEQLRKAIQVSSEVQNLSEEEAEKLKKIKIAEELLKEDSLRNTVRENSEIKKELNMFNVSSLKNIPNIKEKSKLEKTLDEVETLLKKIREEKSADKTQKDLQITELQTKLDNTKDIKDLLSLDEEVTNLINDTTTTEDQLFNLRELKSSIAAKREELIKINKDKLNNKFKQQIGNIKVILENSNITTEELEKARYKLNECRLFAEENNLQEIQLEKINELDALRDKLSEELYQKNLKENSLTNEEDSWANEYIDIDDAYVEINNIIDNNENQGPIVNECLTIDEIEKNELKDLEEESININKVKEKTLENETKNNQKQKNDENVKKINGNNTKKCENNTKVLYNKNEKINKTFKNNSKNNFKSSKKSSSTIELDI
ncbi:TPA: type IV secretory system conjugative DNA transfer family protein [Clostridium perfringens]|uniref:Type IV secretory system conjugative DNA transfer family protein n=1 Tax=Clostridium perfringens TaxID=1502 RepID=A0A8H9R059_CLOPF|nr:type IV secretory system conjugative DNA transfer family protein [Clostridium perfringens]